MGPLGLVDNELALSLKRQKAIHGDTLAKATPSMCGVVWWKRSYDRLASGEAGMLIRATKI